jgi:hypothetical protein
MSDTLMQEFFLPATGGTAVELTGEPIPLQAAVRASLQLVHVSSAAGGSKFKVELQTTSDGVDWTTLASPTVNWSSSAHNAPGTELAYSNTALANSTACRLRIAIAAASYDSLIRVTLKLQEVR